MIDISCIPDQTGFKGTVVNRTCHNTTGESLESHFTSKDSLKGVTGNIW